MLYRPQRFEAAPTQATEFARRLGFGLLVSQLDGELQFSHLPLIVDVEGDRIVRLRGHFSRLNPHWRALKQQPHATVVFNGPDAYVSAQWYTPECQAAPSWNYVTVHASGVVRLLDTPEETTAIVNELIAINEARLPRQWNLAGYSPERRAALTPHILGFALDVSRMEEKFKLSQHHAEADRRGAIAGLRSVGDCNATRIADMMEAVAARPMDTAARLGGVPPAKE